jgi:hypothetical protein
MQAVCQSVTPQPPLVPQSRAVAGATNMLAVAAANDLMRSSHKSLLNGTPVVKPPAHAPLSAILLCSC